MESLTIASVVEGHGEVKAVREFEAWFLAASAAAFDMGSARSNSSSFDKFWREVERLILGS